MPKSPSSAAILCCVIGLCLVAPPVHAEKLKSRSYKKNKATMGVVLMDANWGRRWGCAGYDNAQLTALQFELIGNDEVSADDKYASIVVKPKSRLFVNPVFLNYGFLVRPGEYGLTGISIKVARTRSDVFRLVADREKLVSDGVYHGGTFHVDAGEVVYIGNFGLDCLESPILWRYYTEGAENFAGHVEEYKRKYKFLKDSDVVYRLFDTENFGYEYALPSADSEKPAGISDLDVP